MLDCIFSCVPSTVVMNAVAAAAAAAAVVAAIGAKWEGQFVGSSMLEAIVVIPFGHRWKWVAFIAMPV